MRARFLAVERPSIVALALAGLVFGTACGPRVGVGGVYHGGVRLSSNEDVDDKRHEWFQGLYRDCVDRNFAQACFKTGQNVEDGVVAPPNADDAHWFYARACDLEPFDTYCWAADRTAPEE